MTGTRDTAQPRRRPRTSLVVVALLAVSAAVGTAVLRLVATPAIERSLNRVGASSIEVSPAAARLHGELVVADLHADTLLWDRDLLERAARGHVDVPRLLEGNVALQVFATVTVAPRGPFTRTGDEPDRIAPLAIAQGWPAKTWLSPKERALHQARKLAAAERRGGGRLVVVRTRDDLETLLQRRAEGEDVVGALLAAEGAHPLEGEHANLDVLFGAGFRMLGLAHFVDNAVAGSLHGPQGTGLTELGRRVVARAEELGIVIDLAHSSARTVSDVLELTTRPVVVSHSGVRGTCDRPRNVTDEQLRALARNGGVIGIGYWRTATCGVDARAVARAVRHAVGVAGIGHVGLGSDFDGTVRTPFDTTGLVQVTQALRDEGFSDDDVRRIMGENVVRVLGETLPRAGGR